MPLFSTDRLAKWFISTFYSNTNSWPNDYLYLRNPNYDVVAYKKADLPPVMPDHFRIVIVSDTHELHNFLTPENLPESDIFLHCGDILMINRFFSLEASKVKISEFGSWLSKVPAKRRILIAGNHDAILEKLSLDEIKNTLKCDCEYLVNEAFTHEGVRFFATPLSEGKSLNKAFQSNSFRQSTLKVLPASTDVLITHGHCPEIEKMVKHSIHIWGHAHNSYGIRLPGTLVRNSETVSLSICAALVNKRYCLDKRPIVLDIPKNNNELSVPLCLKTKLESSFMQRLFFCFSNKSTNRNGVTPI